MSSTGDVIAGYRLDELVGRGGMGVVFRATHIALERQGAVKLIAPELALNEEFRMRFQRESRLAASIDHPNVIPIFDAGEEDGQLYVAMRFVDGTDLAALVASRDGLSPEEAVDVIAQVGAALDAAHRRGLVHRDVKPGNVLLESGPSGAHAYLTDFGLVKAVGAASGVLTRTGQWLGTPDFAAPEQIHGRDVDARTDVYSLGCMLYHAVAGKPPFEGDTEVAKIFAHLSKAPPALTEAAPEAPAALDDVIRTALEKDPDARYPSAGELVSAAKRALATPAPAETQSRARHVPSTPPAPATPAPAAPAPAGRRFLLPVAVAILLAAVVVAVLALAGGGDGGDEGSVAVVPADNLTSNPSFERGLSGWDFFQSELAREPAGDAPDGENVARVTLQGEPGEYSIDDFPETVSASQAGRVYTASAWVKATEANGGEPICISLREGLEGGGPDFPFSDASVEAVAGEYRKVTVVHRAEASGKRIGVHVFRSGRGVGEGEAFLVDAITLTEGADEGAGGGRQPECAA
jgi:serine/threonine-protein kinase